MTDHFEIGLYTFAELSPDPLTGHLISPAERIHQFIERVELAEKVGLDIIGLGEHHRPDFVSSAPEVILAAAAARTRSIRLSSAVTVLSSDDPVRVFERFATLDLISNGRAEIMAGRGSFIESFPLFGYDLQDYNELFVEKLELLLKIRANERVTWSGQHRPPIDDRGVYPRPLQEEIPIWIAVGGTPQSVVRAGTLGLNLALAIIGGYPEQFAPLVQLYRQAAEQAGHDPAKLAFSINSHGFIADDRQQALDEAFPYFQQTMNRIGRERGFPPMTRESFNAGATLRGANFIGTPDDVIEKILFQHELFGHQRFLLMPGIGTMLHEKVMHMIDLLGTRVAPVVRKEIARRTK
jgi:probable LLM family oxidoreductase